MEVCKEETLILILIICAYCCNSENDARFKRWTEETAGQGCGALAASFSRRSIPGTSLETGIFYTIKINHSPDDGSGDQEAYITWNWARESSEEKFMNVIADFDNMEKYEKGAEWYRDSHWAFLATEDPDWYHLINCGYPCKYATWRRDEVKDANSDLYYSSEEVKEDGKGYPVIIDPSYPGHHSKEDFLFRPVQILGQDDYYDVEKEDDLYHQTYQLTTKSHNTGIVFYRSSESENSEDDEDYDVLRVISKDSWLESGASLKSSLFTFYPEMTSFDGNHGSMNINPPEDHNFAENPSKLVTCSCKANRLVMCLLILWAGGMTIVSFILTKRMLQVTARS